MDSRISVIHHEKNAGLPEARNTGILHTQAKWVMFLDSDDWIDLDCCEKLANYLKKWQETPDMVIFTGYRNYPQMEVRSDTVYENETWFHGRKEIDNLQRMSLSFTHKTYPAKALNLDSACWRLISMDFIRMKGVKFISVPYKEDAIFFYYSTENAESIVYIQDAFYHYRHTGNSMVNMYRPNADVEQKQYLDEVWNFIKKYNKPDSFVISIYDAVLISMQICITQKFFHESNRQPFRKRHAACRDFFCQEPFRSALATIDFGNLRRNHLIKAVFIKYHLYAMVAWMRILYNRRQKKGVYE